MSRNVCHSLEKPEITSLVIEYTMYMYYSVLYTVSKRLEGAGHVRRPAYKKGHGKQDN